MCYSQARCL